MLIVKGNDKLTIIGNTDNLKNCLYIYPQEVQGGLVRVNVLAGVLFCGVSGSAVADVSSPGVMLIPMMKKKGYDADFSVAVTVSSAGQGIIIPLQ